MLIDRVNIHGKSRNIEEGNNVVFFTFPLLFVSSQKLSLKLSLKKDTRLRHAQMVHLVLLVVVYLVLPLWPHCCSTNMF